MFWLRGCTVVTSVDGFEDVSLTVSPLTMEHV